MKNLPTFEEFANKVRINEKMSMDDKIDAINAYGRLAKRAKTDKDIEELAVTYNLEKEFDGELVKNYQIILKKYKVYDKVIKYIEDNEDNFVDPAGGHGLHSYESNILESNTDTIQKLEKVMVLFDNIKKFDDKKVEKEFQEIYNRVRGFMRKLEETNESLNEGIADEDCNQYLVICRDPEGSLKSLIEYIGTNGNTGHSFSIVVDPDMTEEEGKRSFSWDGDGSDYIKEVRVINTPKKK